MFNKKYGPWPKIHLVDEVYLYPGSDGLLGAAYDLLSLWPSLKNSVVELLREEGLLKMVLTR